MTANKLLPYTRRRDHSSSDSMTHIVGISGSLSKNSRTSIVIQQVLDAATRVEGVTAEMLEVSEANLVFCDGRQPDKYEGDTKRALDLVIAADAYVIGSPMYRGSYTGSFKNLFDLLPNDALKGKPVGLTATGGSDHHYLALEHQLRPLVAFFNAYSMPTVVYAQNANFDAQKRLNDDVRATCEKLAQEIVQFAEK
jgi:FMN reductase